jgi:hypothetical protein
VELDKLKKQLLRGSLALLGETRHILPLIGTNIFSTEPRPIRRPSKKISESFSTWTARSNVKTRFRSKMFQGDRHQTIIVRFGDQLVRACTASYSAMALCGAVSPLVTKL